MSRMTDAGSWLLGKLARGPYTDSVTGDLMEGVQAGRRAGWYWRQVVWVIAAAWVAGVRERRGRIVFAALWAALWPAWQIVARGILYWQMRATVDGLDLPARQVVNLGVSAALNATFLWTGLLVYLAIDKGRWQSVPLRRFVYGWAASFGIFVVGKTMLLMGGMFLLWKMGVVQYAMVRYFLLNDWVGEPAMAALSLLVAIAVMVPVRRRWQIA